MSAVVHRRDVLRASLAAGGAFLLEVAGAGCGPGGIPAPVQPGAKPGDFVPNAWLRITPDDKIVFTLDRVEMGQGTMTSHAQILADELEVSPSRFVVELAGADRAYDNTDSGVGMQVTGGSTSVKSSYDPLRRAGAAAREMLRRAGARRFAAPLDDCRAEDGAIVHVPTGRRLRYGELAADASREEIPHVDPKPDDKHTWIGKSITRLDARMKVDGSGVYGIDVGVPGMVNAIVLRPPQLEAEVVSVDDRAARAMPGVIDVVRIPQGVAVVAARFWQAQRAAAAVKVEWSGGAAWVDGPALWKIYLDRVSQPGKAVRTEGSVSSAEREAQRTIEAIYEVPYLAHATMEPQNATAFVTPDKCEVWAPTQGPALVREVVRRITGLPHEAITVHQTLLGGGFGRRGASDYVEEAVQIALRVKRPVKVTWTREDDMRHSPYRPMAMSWVRGSVDARGSIVSWTHRIVSQSIVSNMGPEWLAALVPHGVPSPMKALTDRLGRSFIGGSGVVDPTSVEGAATMAYAIPNLRFEHAVVRHPIPVAPWRSVGNSINVFTTEAFFDELCAAGGKDPYQARRDLLGKAPRNRAVLDLAAEKAGWGKPLPKGRFRGIAQAESFASYCAHVVEASVEGRDVRVHRVVSAVDCGVVVNPDLVRAQIESAIVFGLGPALRQEITWKNGAVVQSNFHDYEPLRMHETPAIEVHIVPSKEHPTGVGEPGVPPIAPAVANAVLAATGRPVRALPFTRGLLAPPVMRQ
jgi:CO/xanthine dehydrogenase Mo-binding subunit